MLLTLFTNFKLISTIAKNDYTKLFFYTKLKILYKITVIIEFFLGIDAEMMK